MKRTGSWCVAALQVATLSYGCAAFAMENPSREYGVSNDTRAMARAFAAGGVKAADAADVQVLEARNLVAKTLGEDARDLVFVPVAPCTVWDTRFAASAPYVGAIGPVVTRQFYSHLDGSGGDFTPYGGNPACTEANQTFLGGRPFAVMMTVYVNNPVGNGWLTFYRDGDPDPSNATISVYYSPGPTRTQTVISKSSRGYGTGTYDIAVTGRYSTADASASVTGYFIKPVNITLPASTVTTGNILKNGTRFIHNYGTSNTFIGENAGNFTMTGAYNTASGFYVLNVNTTGSWNAASGYGALSSNTTGGGNTAIGGQALYSNVTGGNNTASGAYALLSNTTGGGNTAVGVSTLQNNTTGANNIAVGYGAGMFLTTGNYNIHIGSLGAAAESNTIRIGDVTRTRAFIFGIRGVTTDAADAIPVLIDSAGQLGTVSSSRRFKDDIADMSDSSAALMKLRPVTFHYKTDSNHSGRRLQYGLIAEEVAEVYPGLVVHSADGQVETVMYQYLPSMLLNEVQKQQRRIEAQTIHMARLERETARIAELERERLAQAAEIAGLKKAVAEVAELRQQMAHLARLLERERSGAVTAGLSVK